MVRIYFHPNVKIDMAVAQVTATMQTALRQMPPGMFPANVLKYDAASVPILQLGLSSKTLREQEIFDLGNNFIRTPLGTVQGASVSYPFGGKQRAVMVDLNLDELYAKQLSPIDVSNALNLQNLILPAGTAKLAETEYQIRVNSSPILLDELNNLPIKTVNGATVYIKDVAQVHDGFSVQNNIVRTNGSRGVLITITRNGKASTLAIVERREGGASPDSRHRSAGAEGGRARRPVDLRARLHSGRGARSADRRRPHRHDDPAVSGKLAQHADRLHLDSAFHSHLALHSEPVGTDHQRDDARRPGAGGRHPGGRRHGRDREHAPQPRHAQAADPRGAGWRRADRRPHLCRHALDLHRVRPGAAAHRNGAVFVHAAGHGGGLRHARFYLLSRTLVPTMVAYLLKSEVDLYQQGIDGETAGGKGLFWRVHHLFNALFERLRFRYIGLLIGRCGIAAAS